MLFAIICIDKPGHGHIRAETRPRHLDYMNASAGQVKVGGPLLDDAGAASIGSLILLEADDLAAARAWAADDPYAQAGLFQSTVIQPWKHVLGVEL